MPITTGDTTWLYWTDTGTTSATTVWTDWVRSTASSTATTITYTDTTWRLWVDIDGVRIPVAPPLTAFQRPVETPEQRAARDPVEQLRLQQEQQRVTAAAAAERAAAGKRARRLLNAHLNLTQRTTLKREQFFDVIAGGKRYRVREGWQGNVDELEAGEVVRSFCIHADAALPAEDHMLAQKLLLEADEATFRRIANATERRRRTA